MRDINIKLGNKIKEQREKHGMTQEALSEAAGLSQNFLCQLENGRRRPSISSINKIASALNIPIHLFFKFDSSGSAGKGILKKYETLIASLDKKEQDFVADVIKETAFKLRKLRK